MSPAVAAAIAMLGALILAVLLSSLLCHRSPMATLVALYLRLANPRPHGEPTPEELAALVRRSAAPLSLPRGLRRMGCTEERFEGMTVYTVGGHPHATRAILYLHGGAYVRPPRRHHLYFVARLARKSGCPVILALYPKAPHATATEVLALMDRFYATLAARYPALILMGDSSGGGLAALMLSHAPSVKAAPPRGAILLSPWVDVSLSHPELPHYEALDPLLWAAPTRAFGRAFAGELSPRDGRVSPLYAPPPVDIPLYLFFGTRELLYPDILQYASSLAEAGRRVTSDIARGMNHVYPIYPIPEARRAFKKILNIVNKTFL